MPSGGKLILKTTNVRVTKEGIHDLIGITPGDYVLLTVSDTGYGMGKEVVGHIFEPFFSSKAPGHFGYTVIDCSSGEDALDIYSKQYVDVDLTLLDIGMPGMGGYKCFEELLKINPAARRMITTGYSKDEKVQKALEAGAASCLGKPYKLSCLLKSVRNTLDGKAQLKN